MSTTFVTHACPDPDCDVFPFETIADLQAHIDSGEHTNPNVRAFTPGISARFEEPRRPFTPGAKPASSSPATPSVDGPSDKQLAFLRRLAAERGVDLDLTTVTSKRQASKLIDELMASPAQVAVCGATERQVAFLRKLLTERNVEDFDFTTLKTAKDASLMIDALKATPIPRKQQAPEVECPEGLHLYEDELYKVQRSRSSDALYAKLRVGSDWEYKGKGPLRHLSQATLVTLAMAKEYGLRTGMCCNCGRTLTNPDSIAAGIGPICASRF